MEISRERLLEELHYDPETGHFTRKKTVRGSNKKAGEIVGRVHWKGYLEICFNQRFYRAHRLAWFYVHGKFPKETIDHINGIKTDNRISNLRECSALQNYRYYLENKPKN